MFSPIIAKLKNYARMALTVPQYWLSYAALDGEAFTPTHVDWELTFRCNLRCRICPQELYKSENQRITDSDRELNFEEMKHVVDTLAKTGVKVVTLTGGEPLLHPNALDIAGYIKKKGLCCNILTNGGILSEEAAEKIVKAGIDSLTFSLDGAEEIHDHTRNKKGCFENLCRAAGYIEKYKKIENSLKPTLAFNCTISSLNQDNFSSVVEIARLLGIPTANFAYLFFTTPDAVSMTQDIIELGKVKEENQILPDYLKTIDAKIIEGEIEKCKLNAEKLNININILPDLQGEEINKYFYDQSYSYCSKCFFPWYASRISPYGDVYPCSIDHYIGNVRKTDFPDLWNSQAYKNFRRKLKASGLFPKCKKCCVLNTKLWTYLPSGK